MAKTLIAKNAPVAARQERVARQTQELAQQAREGELRARWTFLTNHTHVLILLTEYPSMVLRQVASRIGITERAVQRIIVDLEQEGYIEREKIGRQNHYRILPNHPLRHPIEAHRTIRDLLNMVINKP
jgi:DNA-binding MarR family transcriptional regulator